MCFTLNKVNITLLIVIIKLQKYINITKTQNRFFVVIVNNLMRIENEKYLMLRQHSSFKTKLATKI